MSSALGSRISELLYKTGMSQRDLAEAIGVTEVSMSRYINGARTPKAPIVSKIAEVLNTTTDYLLGNESTKEESKTIYQRVLSDVISNVKYWSNDQRLNLIAVISQN